MHIFGSKTANSYFSIASFCRLYTNQACNIALKLQINTVPLIFLTEPVRISFVYSFLFRDFFFFFKPNNTAQILHDQ